MFPPRRPAALPREQIIPVFFLISRKPEHCIIVKLRTIRPINNSSQRLKYQYYIEGFFPVPTDAAADWSAITQTCQL